MPTETGREMTIREAGRKGGATTLARYGREHFAENGRKGGKRLRELADLGRAAEEQARAAATHEG